MALYFAQEYFFFKAQGSKNSRKYNTFAKDSLTLYDKKVRRNIEGPTGAAVFLEV